MHERIPNISNSGSIHSATLLTDPLEGFAPLETLRLPRREILAGNITRFSKTVNAIQGFLLSRDPLEVRVDYLNSTKEPKWYFIRSAKQKFLGEDKKFWCQIEKRKASDSPQECELSLLVSSKFRNYFILKGHESQSQHVLKRLEEIRKVLVAKHHSLTQSIALEFNFDPVSQQFARLKDVLEKHFLNKKSLSGKDCRNLATGIEEVFRSPNTQLVNQMSEYLKEKYSSGHLPPTRVWEDVLGRLLVYGPNRLSNDELIQIATSDQLFRYYAEIKHFGGCYWRNKSY